jgi:hypothetical protein
VTKESTVNNEETVTKNSTVNDEEDGDEIFRRPQQKIPSSTMKRLDDEIRRRGRRRQTLIR